MFSFFWAGSYSIGSDLYRLLTLSYCHIDEINRMANRKIGEAKEMTQFEVNPANLSGFWREI